MPDIVMLCALADFFEVATDELLGRNKMEEFVICDDARIVRETLGSIIMKEGYSNIVLAENGKQLLDALEKKAPYAVFLDISLPDANGLELLRKIKGQDAGTRVVMVTADAEQTKSKAVELGADAYITKPFLPEHVVLALNSL